MQMLAAILFPMAAGLGLLLSGCRSRRAREIYVLVCAAGTAGLALWAIFSCYEKTVKLITFTQTLSFSLRVDGLGAVFGGMVALLWVVSAFYALEYMKHEGNETRFFSFFLLSFGVTLGVAFSANILTLYLFYELLTLSTLPMVMHAMDDKARYAGKGYILYSMAGAGLAFGAVVFLCQNGAGDAFVWGGALAGAVRSGEELAVLFYVLGFFGFGVKAAVFPFHGWLLRASVAPTPVTALLHAVAVVKSGVFAVMRLTYFAFGPELLRGSWGHWLVMGAAALTIVYGSANALRTPHLKRRLAWSTVSNLSYILLGVTAMSAAGLAAGLSHMVFHAVLKITLFFCAGAVLYKTGREYVYQLENFGYSMPVVMGCFAAASLGLMGVPPLAGFASKWALARAALGSGLPLGQVGAAALILSAVLTALYLISVIVMAYIPRRGAGQALAPPPTREERRDPNFWMKGPLLLLTAVSVLLGLWSQPVMEALTALAGG